MKVPPHLPPERQAPVGGHDTNYGGHDTNYGESIGTGVAADGTRIPLALRAGSVFYVPTIYDASKPHIPRSLAALPLPLLDRSLPPIIRSTARYGDSLPVATSQGLSIVDVARPAAPRLTATLYQGEWVNLIRASPTLAYAATARRPEGRGALQVLDLSVPDQPVERGRYEAHTR